VERDTSEVVEGVPPVVLRRDSNDTDVDIRRRSSREFPND